MSCESDRCSGEEVPCDKSCVLVHVEPSEHDGDDVGHWMFLFSAEAGIVGRGALAVLSPTYSAATQEHALDGIWMLQRSC